MQTLFGFVLGVFLTVGAAYIHDASVTAPALDANTTTAERRMVNWDVVVNNSRALKSSVDSGWHKLQSISIG
jgi:hypothetical protein